ncbi:MAG: hypothetical protein CVU55_05835 [Deltaproteobacteria bacterium HGW-Deltaproteobacteria-13]|jgi:hypothetical protein|nr:MAG: hypothetical protein CVU55_05835 [Deltaproteobacteria bacterium HGW-Deltaproteobacteria-13]
MLKITLDAPAIDVKGKGRSFGPGTPMFVGESCLRRQEALKNNASQKILLKIWRSVINNFLKPQRQIEH